MDMYLTYIWEGAEGKNDRCISAFLGIVSDMYLLLITYLD